MSTLRGNDRLIVFSPMPPLENGIADYTAELLPLLGAARNTTVVVDDHAPEPPAHSAYRVIRLAEYAAHETEYEGTAHLYQVGNNADHVYLLPWLVRRPGVVVLHDVSLHHLVDQATLRWGDADAYGAMLELEYGAPGRLLARQFHERGWRSRAMFYELPLTREMLARARAVIVHSLYAATKVAAQQGDVPITLVRHHVAASALNACRTGDRAAARAALGVPPDAVLLVSLGFVTRAKQIETVLRFLKRHRAALPRVYYIIAGQDQPRDFDVRALIAELGLEDVVRITGYVDEPAFYRHILAADIVVNLRYPSGGETSGTLIRALAVGACVVVNDIGPFAEFPDEVCAKVSVRAGVSEPDFERVMLQLIASPVQRRRFAEAAARYMRETHSIDESARRYLRALREHVGRRVLPLAERSETALLPAARREALLASVAVDKRVDLPLWATEATVPVAAAGSQDRALMIGDGHDRLLQEMFGYASTSIDIVSGVAHADASCTSTRRTHRIAVVECGAGEIQQSLTSVLRGVNHRLVHNGHLLLTVVDRSSMSASSVARVGAAVEAYGFVVERTVRSRDTLSFSLDAHGTSHGAGSACDSVLICARKCSEFIVTRPEALFPGPHALAA